MQAQDKESDNAMENQITEFKQQLGQKSNQELNQVASQLETIEKVALKQKISNQLDTIQESLSLQSDNGASASAQDKSSNGTPAKNESSEKSQNQNTKNQQH